MHRSLARGVPAGQTSDQLASSLDFLPTFAAVAGAQVPADRPIDGCDLSAWWRGDTSQSPREEFYYFHRGSCEAVRRGEWKLHLRKNADTMCELYDLSADIGETNNVAAQHPTIVAELQSMVKHAQRELGDRAEGITGSAVRPVGRVAEADTLTHYDPAHPYIIAEYDLSDAG